MGNCLAAAPSGTSNGRSVEQPKPSQPPTSVEKPVDQNQDQRVKEDIKPRFVVHYGGPNEHYQLSDEGKIQWFSLGQMIEIGNGQIDGVQQDCVQFEVSGKKVYSRSSTGAVW